MSLISIECGIDTSVPSPSEPYRIGLVAVYPICDVLNAGLGEHCSSVDGSGRFGVRDAPAKDRWHSLLLEYYVALTRLTNNV